MDNDKSASERILFRSDLMEADEIILTNSVRKTIKVDSLYADNNLLKQF